MKDETINESKKYLTQGYCVAQGDVIIKPVNEFPVNIEKSKDEDGKYIIAHSETGHHHAIDLQKGLYVYDQDEFFSYIDNKTDNVIELKHYRSFDRHKTIGIPPGKFKVIRQREYTPEGFRRAID
jgi:hypothetical protein